METMYLTIKTYLWRCDAKRTSYALETETAALEQRTNDRQKRTVRRANWGRCIRSKLRKAFFRGILCGTDVAVMRGVQYDRRKKKANHWLNTAIYTSANLVIKFFDMISKSNTVLMFIVSFSLSLHAREFSNIYADTNSAYIYIWKLFASKPHANYAIHFVILIRSANIKKKGNS